jgi:hypothetical protein
VNLENKVDQRCGWCVNHYRDTDVSPILAEMVRTLRSAWNGMIADKRKSYTALVSLRGRANAFTNHWSSYFCLMTPCQLVSTSHGAAYCRDLQSIQYYHNVTVNHFHSSELSYNDGGHHGTLWIQTLEYATRAS